MYVVRIEDNYHYVRRCSPDVTLCRLRIPPHSMALAPVQGAGLVTCMDCHELMELDDTDTHPVTVVSDEDVAANWYVQKWGVGY